MISWPNQIKALESQTGVNKCTGLGAVHSHNTRFRAWLLEFLFPSHNNSPRRSLINCETASSNWTSTTAPWDEFVVVQNAVLSRTKNFHRGSGFQCVSSEMQQAIVRRMIIHWRFTTNPTSTISYRVCAQTDTISKEIWGLEPCTPQFIAF